MIRTSAVVPSLLFALAALIGAASAAPASAQECVLDRCLRGDAPARAERSARAPVAPGDFDYYVLALSWSPGFCAVSGGTRDPEQCGRGANLGFVVHGLWPQRERGMLADCEAGLRPPARADAAAAARDLFPTEGLARYEWRKHGGCTGLPPSAYFAAVRSAREQVVIPAALAEARESRQLAPQDVLRAFAQANPRLRPGMAAVSCPKNVLQEVRICLSKDLRDFTSCPDVAARSCRARQIEAPPPS
jgi:ribonuclease T2